MYITKIARMIDEAVGDCIAYGRGESHDADNGIQVAADWAENETDIEITILENGVVRLTCTETINTKEETVKLKPEIGRVYANRNGRTYRCLWSSDTGATFINDESGQTFQAAEIIQHTDGTIEWARSNEEATK